MTCAVSCGLVLFIVRCPLTSCVIRSWARHLPHRPGVLLRLLAYRLASCPTLRELPLPENSVRKDLGDSSQLLPTAGRSAQSAESAQRTSIRCKTSPSI